jgi:hypothetical protein
MPLVSRPSFWAYAALIYITAGILTDVWSGIWYWYLTNFPPSNAATWYWCYGFLLSGLALLVIGLLIGPIGRAARRAELPPHETTPAEARTQQTVAARAPMVAPTNAAAPAVVSEPRAGEPRVPSPPVATPVR